MAPTPSLPEPLVFNSECFIFLEQGLAGTIPLNRSCWLRLLLQEPRCSLVTGLNRKPQCGLRLDLASSCESIRGAVPFFPTESFRLSLKAMIGLINDLMQLSLENPLLLIGAAFQLWMMVDALRREEWIWAACILFFSVFSAVFYYFMVYRAQASASGGMGLRGFELPGAADRRRIKELESRIHHLDKARDHLDLADLYFSQGKLTKAEASYRRALERDPEDDDTVSHLGQCLLRQGKAAEAKPLLEKILKSDPRHDFGYTLMALAETQTALGEVDAALLNWKRVLENNSYPRARVQYAELLASRGMVDEAQAEIDEVLADQNHSPAFEKSRNAVWIRRARKLESRL